MEETNENVVKKIPKGMVEFVYGKAHGTLEKGHKTVMHRSTAEALVTHKIGKIAKEVKVIKKKETQ